MCSFCVVAQPLTGPAEKKQKKESKENPTNSKDPKDPETKELTGKKLEQHLKREAAKEVKKVAAAKRKAEAARAKEAKANTRKTVALSSRMTAFNPASDVLKKAQDIGLAEPDVDLLQKHVTTLSEWSKACGKAMHYFTKNQNAELETLPFTQEDATLQIKDCNACVKNVRKLLAEFKKNNKAAAAEKPAGTA